MSLTMISDYKDIPEYRLSFNQLAGMTFGIDFEKWYQGGFWDDRYICYSYTDQNQVVANVSISIMDLIISGQNTKALQIGTVMTHPGYQKQGLARDLMNIILAEHERNYDMIYLFANQSVLDFYPKFGFQPVRESRFSLKVDSPVSGIEGARKLNISNSADLRIIYEWASQRMLISSILGACRAQGIFMWYCFNVFGDAIYYLAEEETIVICKPEARILHVYDVVSKHPVEFQPVLAKIATPETREVVFYFTPDFRDVNAQLLAFEPDDVLFIKAASISLPERFKYPMTAQA